jgi:hypothetical protein
MKRKIPRPGISIAFALFAAFVLLMAWRTRTSTATHHASNQLPHLADAYPAVASASVGAAAQSIEEISAQSPVIASKVTRTLWASPVQVGGNKLAEASVDAVEARLQGHAAKGRSGVIPMESIASLENLQEGQEIALPLFDGQSVQARVQHVTADQDWVRTGGTLVGERKGTFFLSTNGSKVSGAILLPEEKLAYQVEYQENGQTVMNEKLLSDVVCSPIPLEPNPQMASALDTTGPVAAVPALSSRPTAVAVLYLDFDGETVTDPAWAGGATINAVSFNKTDADITEIWKRVKEDYIIYNVDVTTDVNRYNSAPVGKRMRCIITPTNTAAPGSGGVAYLNSFARAGSSFSSTIPCWVFNSGIDGISEAVAHELGHTFGLAHDGRTTPAEAYYFGQGTGVTRWAPIMGASYQAGITQWSKGEYGSANNHEDDVAVIGNAANGIGFIADEAGNTLATATPLNAPGGTINQFGVITQQSDVDFYSFTTSGGAISVNAGPAATRPNLDILLQLLSPTGTVLAESNPDQAFNAAITTTVGAGTYALRVAGTGRGDVLVDGYTSYGSLGEYNLTGSFPVGTLTTPVITSTGTVAGTVNSSFSYQITATNSPTSYSVTGALPAGVSLNVTTGLISGTPTVTGAFSVTVGAANSAGTGTRSVTITINASITAPVITSASTATGTINTAFAYQITATNSPTGYSVTGALPAGVSVNATSGLISGTPTVSGTFNVMIGATNSAGTGSRSLAISINSVVLAPVITSADILTSSVGQTFTYQIIATNSPTSFNVVGALPAGLSFTSATGQISGTPTTAGTTTVTIGATNAGGTGTKLLTFKITSSGLTLEAALDSDNLVWTTGGDTSWAPQTTVTSDGVDAAQAGNLTVNQTSWVETKVTGPVTLSFKWKVSSERFYDYLLFSANGRVITRISGEQGWNTRTYRLSSAATYILRWSYTKDESVDRGRDTGWLDQVIITP